jgi:hypothetical protein
MSTRLTNDARDKIIDAAMVKSGFPERIKEAKTVIEDIKMECLIYSFGGLKAYRRLCDRFDTLDEKVKELQELSVGVVSLRSEVNWNNNKMNLAGMQIHYPRTTTVSKDKYAGLRLLYKQEGQVTITGDNPLVQKFLDADKALKDLQSSHDQIEDNVKAVVYSVNTTKRLIEVWPESAELIPKDIEVIRAGLPAINFTSLNASIGIPSDKKA